MAAELRDQQALRAALRETLDAKGVLRELRARIQAEVFSAVRDTSDPRPRLSQEKLLLNEAIREYLEFSGYNHTLSVFLAEAGQPEEKLARQVVAGQLRLPLPRATLGDHRGGPSSKEIPVLYSLFADEASRQEQPVPLPAAGEATPRPAAAQPLRRDLPFSIAS